MMRAWVGAWLTSDALDPLGSWLAMEERVAARMDVWAYLLPFGVGFGERFPVFEVSHGEREEALLSVRSLLR